MASTDIKGFYKQKKRTGGGGGGGGGQSKPYSSKHSIKSGKKEGGVPSLGSGNPPQTPALIAHGTYDLNNEYGEEGERLRSFDMDMRYGPCIGMNRLQRWERAHSMGLDPPSDVHQLLLSRAESSSSSGLDCLWEGRV